MTKDKYSSILRIIGFVSASALWWLSVHFSSRGFGFEMGEDTSWIGIILALVITAIQIIWNHEAHNTNLTMFFVCICSYAYGIWANVIGIIGLRNGGDTDILAYIFPMLLGLFVEVVPEPMLVWAITGEWSTGDFFGNLINPNSKIPKFTQKHPNRMEICRACGQQVKAENLREHLKKCPALKSGKGGKSPAPMLGRFQ